MSEKQIVKEISGFGIIKYFSYFFAIISGFIVVKTLGPALFGVYSILALIITYGQHAHLGLRSGLTKKYPYLIGKGRKNDAIHTVNLAFTTITGIIVILSSLLLIGTLSFFGKLTPEYRIGLLFVSVILILQQMYFFFQAYLRAEKDFALVNRIILLLKILHFLGVLLLVFKFKLYGVLAAMVLSHLIVTLYAWNKKKFKPKKIFSFKEAFALAKYGFPLFLLYIVSALMVSIDKLMIAKFLSPVEMGYYSLSVLLFEVVLFIPAAIEYVIFPYQVEKYAKKGLKSVFDYLHKALLVLAYLMPFIIMIGYVLVEPFLIYMLPEYTASLFSMRILLLTVFFLSLFYVNQSFLVAVNDEKKLLIIQGSMIVLAVVVDYFLIRQGFGINGVAFGTFGVAILGYLVATLIAYRHFKKPLLKTYPDHMLPFVLNLGLLYMLTVYLPVIDFSDYMNTAVILSVKLISILLFNLPLFYIIDRRTKLISIVLRLIFRRS